MDTQSRKFGPWVTAVWSQDDGWQVQWASVGPQKISEVQDFIAALVEAAGYVAGSMVNKQENNTNK